MWIRASALFVLGITATACGSTSKHVRREAATQLQCSEHQVHLQALNKQERQYLAQGCGRRAVFEYSRDIGPMRVSQIEGIGTDGQPLTPQSSVNTPPAAPNGPPPPPPPAP